LTNISNKIISTINPLDKDKNKRGGGGSEKGKKIFFRSIKWERNGIRSDRVQPKAKKAKKGKKKIKTKLKTC